MTDFEWTRIVTVILAIVAIIQLILFFRRTHEYAVIAPIAWLAMVVANAVFKFIVDGDPKYYNAAVLINNLIFIYGIVLVIIGGFLFRDIKSWTYRK